MYIHINMYVIYLNIYSELNESFVLNTIDSSKDRVYLEVKIGHMFFDFPDVLFPDVSIGKGKYIQDKYICTYIHVNKCFQQNKLP
jgi:hypothetical protein